MQPQQNKDATDQMNNKITCYNKITTWLFPRTDNLNIKESPCCSNTIPLLIFRICAFLYFMVYYFLNLASGQVQSLLSIFLFLTNVGYFFTWLYFVNAVQYYIVQSKDPKNDYQYAIELLFEIAFCLQVTITLLYWILLFRGTAQGYEFYANFSVHAAPMILLFFDFIFNSYRFHPPQVIVIIVIAAIYGFGINLPFTLSVMPIYPILDWQTGLSYGLVIGAIALSALFFGLSKLLWHCIKQKMLTKKQNNHTQIEVQQQSS